MTNIRQGIVNQIEVFDVSTKKMLTSDEGYTTFPAFATRTGVLKYRQADGAIIKQYRPESEVFNADSLRTLANKPITNSHPSRLIDAKNTRDHMVGATGSEIVRDGGKVGVTLTLMDQNTIDDVLKRGKVELSCGYRCEHDFSPGVFDGEPYDLIQRNITYNHLAVVAKGRAGSNIKIHTDGADFEINLDSEDGVVIHTDVLSNNDIKRQLESILGKKTGKEFIFVVDIIGNQVIYQGDKGKMFSRTFNQDGDKLSINEDEVEVVKVTSFKKMDQVDLKIEKVDNKHDPEEDKKRRKKLKEAEKMKRIAIDGVEQEVSDEFKEAFDSAQNKKKTDEKKDAEISKLQAERDALQSKLDSQDETGKKTQLDSEINEKVNARVKLYQVAKDHCEDEVVSKIDSLSDIEIKKEVIKTTMKDSEINLDDKDEHYISARFDMVMEDAPAKSQEKQDKALGEKILETKKDSSHQPKSDPQMNAYKKPLTLHKTGSLSKEAA